jgi:hypothetical protein
MKANAPSDWRHFERLVAALQRRLYPNASVDWDVKVPGALSGVPRQIDVTVRGRLLANDASIVIDCKYLSAHVDVKDVETVAGLFDDVGATKRMLVTSLGYSPAALRRAGSLNVDTYVLRPARDEDWEGFLRSLYLKISLIVPVLSGCEAEREDTGAWIHVDPIDRVRDMNGKIEFLDRILESWIATHTTWEPNKTIALEFTPSLVLVGDNEEPSIRKIRFRATYEDSGFAVESLVHAKQDWVFMSYRPDGTVVQERAFFEFEELATIASSFER